MREGERGVDPLRELIGDSPGMVALRRQVDQFLRSAAVAPRLPAVLILGETGSGKGLPARAIHGAGPRARRPFIDVNCAAIPERLLEAELFGYEKGAFTDARQAKPGLFQLAHQGTLFLDEIGLLALPLQSKLLTALEQRVVRRLGSTHSEPAESGSSRRPTRTSGPRWTRTISARTSTIASPSSRSACRRSVSGAPTS